MAGIFITFEGGEGTGKSTQVRLLANRLHEQAVVVTREPGGTAQGEKLRELLVSGAVENWSPTSEALLNSAARSEHVRQVIAPALQAGKIVICDRFMDSTRAYQGYAGGVEARFIDALEEIAVGVTRPDLTLVFDIDPEQGLARAGQRVANSETRFERKGLAFHRALRNGFLEIAHRTPERCKIVDASASIADVEANVWSHVKSLLDGR